ncbi:UBP-type zinc finger domain-containing protein [Kitasatospora sp. NBC_01266]|uniref:UBP-type zinc finger domain-containing protein n=1 Tax=Kitasatospora sp. NBC_01266 TaxID=2903572 RepID=UPI002E33693C|nr:UBP-type zinc finger domain-containing protein [Kitasatospora sp. NBC_01266]
MSERHAWQVAEDLGASGERSCGHLGEVREVVPSSTRGCEDCLRIGSRWVHLRECLACGHVGCCDSSPKQHAHAHAHAAPGHDLARSIEPGEDWAWCYTDELFLRPAD